MPSLVIRLFGVEFLNIYASSEDESSSDGPGDCTTQPIGFSGSYGDQRWERGVELE